jgi:hypothetical protein
MMPSPDFGGELRGFLTTDADHDGDWLLRHVVDACAVDVKKVSRIGADLAAPQQADDLDGFMQHRMSLLHGRPAAADHVLVETLACSDRKRKPALAHHANRGCCLGDDRRMVANDRAVSPVDIPIFWVVSAIAPRTLQANGECPCDSSHG